MNVRYRVTLTTEERASFSRCLARQGRSRGATSSAHRSSWQPTTGSTDEEIATNVASGTSTVYRTKQRFVEEGLERAAQRAASARRGAEARRSRTRRCSCAVACSKPPAGRARWTLELLADEMVRLTVHDSVSAETIRRRLGEMQLKPGRRRCGASRRSTRNSSPGWRTCSRSTPSRLTRDGPSSASTRRRGSSSAKSACRAAPSPESARRYDYEYVRNGTANVFMFVDVQPTLAAREGHRPANVPPTSPSACATSSTCTIPTPSASASSSTTSRRTPPAALYERFAPDEARRILSRLEFHYTPKHASWLNMVEIEIGVMVAPVPRPPHPRQGDAGHRDRRLGAPAQPRKARIDWMFTVERARRSSAIELPHSSRRTGPGRRLNRSSSLGRGWRVVPRAKCIPVPG